MQPETLPLQDIHLPDPVSWWPPAPGWWLLLVLVPASIFLLIKLYNRLTRKTALSEAELILDWLKQETADKKFGLMGLSTLLRRTAISHYSRKDVASLTGQAWLELLDKPLQDKRFTEGVGKQLLDAPYRASIDNIPIDELFILCEDWLKALAREKR